MRQWTNAVVCRFHERIPAITIQRVDRGARQAGELQSILLGKGGGFGEQARGDAVEVIFRVQQGDEDRNVVFSQYANAIGGA